MTCSIGLKNFGAIAAPVLFAVMAVAGCGGGNSGEMAAPPAAVTVPDSVPPSAGASVQAMFDFQQGLTATNSSEPLTTVGLLPPTSDTAEPFPVN